MTYSPIWTSVFIGVSFVAYLFFDIAVAIAFGNDATLSKSMQRIGRGWPIVVFFYGGLGAHFFLPHTKEYQGLWAETKPYVLMFLGIFVFRLGWAQAL